MYEQQIKGIKEMAGRSLCLRSFPRYGGLALQVWHSVGPKKSSSGKAFTTARAAWADAVNDIESPSVPTKTTGA